MKPLTKELYAYGLSALFGCVGGVITIGMIWLLEFSTKLLWEKGFNNSVDDPSRNLYVFCTIVIASLIAGYFAKKYAKPLIGMDEVVAQIIEKGKIRWQDTGRAFVNGLLSIISGASLGPEAPSAFISAGTSSFAADKLKISADKTKIINIGSISGMLGTLLSSPFLAPVLIASSTKRNIKSIQNLLTYSTVASAFGVATFFGLFHTVAVIDIGLPEYSGAGLAALLQAFLIGLVAALFLAIISKIITPLISKITTSMQGRPLTLALVSGLITATIAFALPLTMFSGQYTISTLIEKSADIGIVLLIVIAIAKLFSTLLLLKSGFFGGPIFPMIFVGTTIGIIVTHIIAVPLTLAVAASVSGALTAAMRQPLSVALLTIGILGVNVTSVVAIAVAGAALLLTLTPQKSDNKA